MNKLLCAAFLILTRPIMAQSHQPPQPTKTDGGWCCTKPYWPFQSWTHKWSCVKGEHEAKSTWNLYKEPLQFVAGAWTIDYEKAWYVSYTVDGAGYKCDLWKRKDGLVHSLIIGQEYTQTCEAGKLGLLVPVEDVK